MRITYLTVLLGMAIISAFAQAPAQLTAEDKREIKAEARRVIEVQLHDLLNSIAQDGIGIQGRKLIIFNSFLSSENQIFDTNAIIEDDTSPEVTVSRKGFLDLKVQAYLEKLDMIYTKSAENTIKISEVNVTDVKQGAEYPYVLAHFKIHFTNKHRTKPDMNYAPIYRTAEFRAEKLEKQWKVLMTGIRYFKEAPAQPVVAQVPAATSAVQARETPREVKKNTASVPVAQNKQKEPDPVKPASKPEQTVKTQEPVQTTRVETKKPEPQAIKPADKSPELALSSPASVASPAIQQLEAQAAKFKLKTNIFRAGAGVAVAGAIGTFVVVNSAYGDYKSQIDKNNTELQAWWGQNENGRNFGSIENYTAKPKSLIEFGSPGIYFVGAGVIAGGVLWFLSSGSNKQAKEYKKQLEQKRKQLSIVPGVSGSQRYAGIQIRYKF